MSGVPVSGISAPTASPQQRYQNDLKSGLLQPDAAQAAAIEAVEQLYKQLLAGGQSNGLGR